MSTDHIAIGPGPFQLGFTTTEDARTGADTEYDFEGSFDECRALKFQMRSAGASAIVINSASMGRFRLRASFPYDENGQQTFPAPAINELEIEVAQVEIYKSPKLRSLLSDVKIAAVRSIAMEYMAAKYENIAAALSDVSDKTGGSTVAANLFGCIIREEDAYVRYDTVYRKTLTAATSLQVQASYTGAGKIWTTQEVLGWESYNTPGWFQLPSDSLWLKSPPSVTATARQKTQIVYHYTGCKNVNGLVYDAYGSAILENI